MSVRMRDADPALETLLLPLAEGRLDWPAGGVLFLRARDGWPLHAAPRPGLVAEQSFRPDAQALEASGIELVGPGDARRYPLVMLLPPRQRDESRALMARALASLAPGGRVLACVPNSEGARSAEQDLAAIAGPVETISKNKCRVFWTAPLTAAADPALAARWQALDDVRTIDDPRFASRPGVFAWDRIDPASRLLAEHLPDDLGGVAADLGAGFGYLSVELLERCPGVASLHLYEAESRALELARQNLAPFAQRAALEFRWHDVTTGLPQAYDVIVTNPPFHTQSRADRPDIGRRFIAVAAQALRPGGRLWLVANRHLPYESVLDASFGEVRTVAQRDGFKVIEAVKAIPARPERAPRPFDRTAARNAHR
ncbi:class I SAM-dependent methyltransferase [Lysobacter sp. A3-1-A15]|uniref:class I SAM-dependent methyltransferase n=1 Tax=Novilysobacter viscosus TaxID=3098602 RepID=UPI003983A4E9